MAPTSGSRRLECVHETWGRAVAAAPISFIEVNEAATRRGALCGIAAAVTFGASAPLATSLVADIHPQLLAGLLYLGAAIVLLPLTSTSGHRHEARLRAADLPRLALIIAAGGIVAPVLLLFGLEQTGGLAGSLLLNLEAPITALIAVAVFRDTSPARPPSPAASSSCPPPRSPLGPAPCASIPSA